MSNTTFLLAWFASSSPAAAAALLPRYPLLYQSDAILLAPVEFPVITSAHFAARCLIIQSWCGTAHVLFLQVLLS